MRRAASKVDKPAFTRTPEFARLFEALPHPYLIVRADDAFTIVAVNERYLAATGTRREDLVGRALFDAFPDNPADATGSAVSDLRTSLLRVKRDRVPDVMGVQKYDIPPRDGSAGFLVKYWSPVNTPVMEADGSVSFIVHHVEDVTEFVLARERAAHASARRREKISTRAERIEAEILRRANEVKEANRKIKAREAELAELNDRLRDVDRLKTEFFSSISHEFRTPLTLMIGPLEHLLARTSPDDSGRAELETAHRNALRLLKLVNTLLEFARLEARAPAPQWQATDIARYTAGIASNFQQLCAQAGLTLRIDCAPSQGLVLIDRDMWERVVLNLVSNAFKFTLAGEITVELRIANGQLDLTVADTGVGIPVAELPRVFERFYRVDSRRGRTFEGSGVGLALVKQLVELLGGTIAVESREHQGSRFRVRLPVKLAPSAAAPDEVALRAPESESVTTPISRAFVLEAQQWLPETARPSSVADQRAGQRARVLVADDNADMRRFLLGLLEEAGYEVITAATGAAAWTGCQESSPDLVLTDLMMPEVSGLELLSRLRKDPRTADLPVMLLSANAAEGARVKGVWSGADDYVVKPFHAEELLARIDAVLHRAADRRRTESELRRAAAVFTSTNDAVIITDVERRIVAVNAAFTRITGYEQDEVLGKNPSLQRSGRHDITFYDALWNTLNTTGYWQGEIWNRRKNGDTYPTWQNISAVKNERGEIINYVSVFSDIASIKETQERMAHLAHHDALTDLPNRLLFKARLAQSLEHARRNGSRVGLLLLDLDRFKLINDTLGHAAGDQLLATLAGRLRVCVRAEDTVARLGGDEFAVILNDLAHPQDAAVIAEKVLHQVALPVMLGTREIISSASIGISLYPEDAETGTDLAKAADAAMYRAKRRGHHAFEFYTAELTAEAEELLALELELPRALAKGELELHYQPQVDVTTGDILGVEALLRWQHPLRGSLPPQRVIEIADSCGFIEPLVKWIVETAARQAQGWHALGLPPMHVAINLSDRQLAHERLVQIFVDALRPKALGGWRIVLDVEITETVISTMDHEASILRHLRALGIGIAIDDFGTGYSSLSRLQSLPIDILKIDRSFIRNLPERDNDRAITAAVISLGHELGLQVVAEGVERQEQLDFLRAHHCDAAQGYFVCRPMRAADVTAFLRSAAESHARGTPPGGAAGPNSVNQYPP